jgi:hypothetical protein
VVLYNLTKASFSAFEMFAIIEALATSDKIKVDSFFMTDLVYVFDEVKLHTQSTNCKKNR